ncbi:hypothetical protein HIM_01824 [Hirsutella minnesotensis 3608]|nr:hypothetical protein HIM_01824 [Hirsutella minnesotensis 3608]
MPWKSAADVASGIRARTGRKSIRGNISSPVPMAPTSDRPDEEFPIRDPGTTFVSPWNVDDSSSANAQETGRTRRQLSVDSTVADSARSDAAHNDQPREELISPAPDEVVCDERPGANPMKGITAGKHRTRETFRSALSKVLGRNKKMSFTRKSDMLGKATPEDARGPSSKVIQSKRSASLPITDYDRALRSHSISPEDVLAIQAIQSARNSLNTDLKAAGNGPDASEATLAHPAAPRWVESRKFTGLSPRPASSHDRRPKVAGWSDDPNQIGRAITSDAQGLRRRSRSLSAFPLPDGPLNNSNLRQADDMRHWRESYEPHALSPLSASTTHEADDVAIFPTDEAEALAAENQPKSPVKPFIFGDIQTMKEAVGLKITEAASLDSRINTLEGRMNRLEQLVTELAKSLPGAAETHRKGPPSIAATESDTASKHRSIDISITDPKDLVSCPITRNSGASKRTFGADGFPDLNLTPRNTALLSHASSTTSRPQSLATMRGASSGHEPSGLATTEQCLTLLTLLESERSAREELESQVRRLSQQVNFATQGAAYTYTANGRVSSSNGSQSGPSVFDHDSVGTGAGRRMNGTKGQGLAARGLGKDADRILSGVAADEDDESNAESFVTPKEKRDVSEFDDEQDAAFRTAARAMSLSRLTHGNQAPKMSVASPPVI